MLMVNVPRHVVEDTRDRRPSYATRRTIPDGKNKFIYHGIGD